LFGGATTPAEPAAPAEKPAEKPAETPAATPPQTPPATTPPAATDDLFGTSSEAPAQPAATPAETPAATPPAEKPATESAPAEQPAEKKGEEKKDEKKADDIFGASPALLHQAGGLASDEFRTWTDNTGNFSCQGRLIQFLDGKVRLAKDNGRTTTVPLSRLSAQDLEFVQQQASAHQASLLQTAEAVSAMPMLAN
jgi:hypothetical protein